MSGPSRILVVRLSALGDVLLATPAVRALAKTFPDARIDWLVEEPYLPLVAANPYARPVAYRKRGEHQGIRGLLALRRTLVIEGYDLVVDLQDKPKARLFHVAGRTIAWRKRTPRQALLSLVGQERPLTRAHAVDLYLEALAPLGVVPDGRSLDLIVTAEMEARARLVLPEGRIVGLAPGARWATKRWAPERFAQLTVALAGRGLRPVLLGGRGDAEAFAAVRASLPFEVPDTATLDVGGLAGAIARCSLVVAGDSGPSHIAAALGTPLVTLFGPTSPKRWGPLSPRADVVRAPVECSPCTNHGGASCPLGHLDCMERLEVAQVLAAAGRWVG
ncbi:MAG: glycosyltransferase family 9 protein [Deltaproteobacteria bacterium]|nr:glycosyltransferase family 9 protein [Deltaproteobacteria bacterium]